MRDPRDPANPYAGQYAAYDVWIYAQAWAESQGAPMQYGDREQAGLWYSLGVDDDGWPVPMKVEMSDSYARERGEDPAHSSCRRQISTFGFMGQTLERLQQEDVLEVRAGHLPPIPGWLAARAPGYAMLLPDGEVVTRGALGTALETSSPDYYRYSATGEQLGTLTADRNWWEFYFKDFEALRSRHLADRWSEGMGYVSRYDGQTGEIRGTWDYTGKRVNGTPPVRPRGYFEWLSADTLVELQRRQTGAPASQAPLNL